MDLTLATAGTPRAAQSYEKQGATKTLHLAATSHAYNRCRVLNYFLECCDKKTQIAKNAETRHLQTPNAYSTRTHCLRHSLRNTMGHPTLYVVLVLAKTCLGCALGERIGGKHTEPTEACTRKTEPAG